MKTVLGILAAIALCGCASTDASKRPPKDHQGARLVRDQLSFRGATGVRLVTGQVKDSVEAWDRFFRRIGD